MSESVQEIDYLNSVFESSLNESSPRAEQPHTIKTLLFPHQLACLHQMIIRVTNSSFKWNNQTVYSKIGILGDQHNSGKTLTALAFLAYNNQNRLNPNTSELNLHSNSFFFSIKSYQEQHRITAPKPINVILVPNHLVYQWKHTIQSQTTLNVFTIDTKSNLSGIHDIPDNSIFLVNSRLFKNFRAFSATQNLCYNFFFIDEATFIYLSSNEPSIEAGYIWLITSDWIPLLVKQLFNFGSQLNNQQTITINPEFKDILEIYKMSYQIYGVNSLYIKNYIPFHHDARFSMVIRCSNEFIQKSVIQRPNICESIVCRPSFNSNSLASFFNLQGNIDKLGELLPYIYQDLNIQIYSPNQILEQEFNGDTTLYSSRINDDCSICLDSPRQKILTPCCRRIYCATCIFKNYLQKYNCPTCRAELNICNIKVIEQNLLSINCSLKYRDDSIVKYLEDNSGSTTIVYSTHQNIYYNIKDQLNARGLTSECLEYSASSNIKKIRNFQDKIYKILFISDIILLNLYGLNFGFVDCLIFVNKIPYLDLKNILYNSANKGNMCKNPQNSLKIIDIRNILE